MAVKGIQETAKQVEERCHHVGCWHKIEGDKSEDYAGITCKGFKEKEQNSVFDSFYPQTSCLFPNFTLSRQKTHWALTVQPQMLFSAAQVLEETFESEFPPFIVGCTSGQAGSHTRQMRHLAICLLALKKTLTGLAAFIFSNTTYGYYYYYCISISPFHPSALGNGHSNSLPLEPNSRNPVR